MNFYKKYIQSENLDFQRFSRFKNNLSASARRLHVQKIAFYCDPMHIHTLSLAPNLSMSIVEQTKIIVLYLKSHSCVLFYSWPFSDILAKLREHEVSNMLQFFLHDLSSWSALFLFLLLGFFSAWTDYSPNLCHTMAQSTRMQFETHFYF